MTNYEVDVVISLDNFDGDARAARRYVDRLLDEYLTPVLRQGVDWEMLDDCVRDVTDEDALDFDRETLGPDATFDEVLNLATLRNERDSKEEQ